MIHTDDNISIFLLYDCNICMMGIHVMVELIAIQTFLLGQIKQLLYVILIYPSHMIIQTHGHLTNTEILMFTALHACKCSLRLQSCCHKNVCSRTVYSGHSFLTSDIFLYICIAVFSSNASVFWTSIIDLTLNLYLML